MRGPDPRIVRGLARALVAGLISAAAMALAILGREEPLAGRAQALIAIWFTAGFGGLIANAAAIAITDRLGWRPLGAWLARLGFLPAFLFVGSLAFLIQNRWQLGGFEPHPDHPIRSVIFSSIQTMILFLVSAPGYLLPWMMPLLVLTGFLLQGRRNAS